MLIRYSKERIAQNGVRESSVQEFEKGSILLGRGADCDLLLSGKGIALRHLRIIFSDGRFTLENVDTLSGTLVNKAAIQRHTLKSGDRLQLGDHILEVSIESQTLTLSEIEAEQSAADMLAADPQSFTVTKGLPSLALVTLLSVLLTLVVVVLYPVVSGNKLFWASGKVTNHHSMIEKDCSSCHSGGFSLIADRKCISCHNLTNHGSEKHKLSKQAVEAHACVSCHREHGGTDALVPKESKLCASCHSNIRSVEPETMLAAVNDWATHPEFSVRLPGASQLPSVSLAEASKLIDNSHVKLNHAIHLQEGLRGAKGPVTLQCHDCHKLASDFKTLVPITMEANCLSCHPLQFDEKISSQVPHANPDVVYKFMYAEYAKLLLAPGDNAALASRMRPGEQTISGEDRHTFVRAEVEHLTREAERELFARTGCKLCHEISELGEAEKKKAFESQQSGYKVVQTEIPHTWMTAARFSHGAHEELTCLSCHPNAAESKATTDVLLPKKELCMQCHSDHRQAGKVASQCILCHSYHDSKPLAPIGKKDWVNGAFKNGHKEMISELAP